MRRPPEIARRIPRHALRRANLGMTARASEQCQLFGASAKRARRLGLSVNPPGTSARCDKTARLFHRRTPLRIKDFVARVRWRRVEQDRFPPSSPEPRYRAAAFREVHGSQSSGKHLAVLHQAQASFDPTSRQGSHLL